MLHEVICTPFFHEKAKGTGTQQVLQNKMPKLSRRKAQNIRQTTKCTKSVFIFLSEKKPILEH